MQVNMITISCVPVNSPKENKIMSVKIKEIKSSNFQYE